jgi:HSP20 family protein
VTRSRDLFAGFERMRREIDELLGDVFERSTGLRGRGFSPSVDVFYLSDPPRAVVEADLAGIEIADVSLEIHGRQLLIAGERRPAEATGRLYQQIEIEHGPFRRLVDLGADVVAERASAGYEDGLLHVEVPLLAAGQGSMRRVPIEGGDV